MVLPDPVTNETDVTVIGNGVIVEVAVEITGAGIVLRKVQVSDKNVSKGIREILLVEGRNAVLKDLHQE